MSHIDAAEARKHARQYLIVFGALLVLTGITVGIVKLDLPVHLAVGLAMAVATVKASLVAAFFMHLISEKKLVVFAILSCFFFFSVLVLIPVVTEWEGLHRTLTH